MLLFFLALLLGLVALTWSADRFVASAALVAQRLGWSSFVIGVLIIGFGTSAPELMVSAMAALSGNPALALGNGYGSNIANIGLVLALVALLAPVSFHGSLRRVQLPMLLLVTLVVMLLLLNGQLSRWDALLHLLLFVLMMYLSLRFGGEQGEPELPESASASAPMTAAWLWLVFALLLLLASSRLLVWGAVGLATAFGVSELIIGLTLVAVGTSLPELASALAAIKQKQQDMVLGNIMGSAFFNMLAVVGLAALISPLSFDSVVLTRDWSAMFVFTLLLWLISWRKAPQLSCLLAGGLLLGYVAYLALLWWPDL